jgi:hypothetical protein
MPQQIAGVPPSTPLAADGSVAPGAPGTPGAPAADGTVPDAGIGSDVGADPGANIPGLSSAAPTLSVAGAVVLAAAGLGLWL